MKALALFNNKGGVGKTTLTFNLAHMAAKLGLRTVAVDYDPQCNLSALFLAEERLEELWVDKGQGRREAKGLTVAACIEDVRLGQGQVAQPALEAVAENLWLLPGHLSLSRFEGKLARMWGNILGDERDEAVRVVSALARLVEYAAADKRADVVFVDVGPSLGALNRSALVSCDAVVVPLAPDLFSLQGLENMGPALVEWRNDWTQATDRAGGAGLPQRRLFTPIGYILQQHLIRQDQPARAYQHWAKKVPSFYHQEVARDGAVCGDLRLEDDPACLGLLRHYASLVPLAQEARKPLFALRTADGVGGRMYLVRDALNDFRTIMEKICQRMGIPLPTP